jgi:hypothetical protein
VFDVQGVVPVGYTVFAVALGAAAGALTRRTVPAMAITVGGFLAARIGVQQLRAHLFTPLRSVHALISPPEPSASAPRWSGLKTGCSPAPSSTAAGHAVPDQAVLQTCRAIGSPRGLAPCITAHGYHQLDIYQPLGRYWPLQGIEFANFTALAAALLAATIWAVARRHSPRPRFAAASRLRLAPSSTRLA